MMMVLVSGAQTFTALLTDFWAWRDYSPQPPALILVPHGTVEDILAGGVEDRRFAVSEAGLATLSGIPVLCLCGATSRLPEFDCPAVDVSIADEVLAPKEKELRAHDLPPATIEKLTPKSVAKSVTKKTAKKTKR